MVRDYTSSIVMSVQCRTAKASVGVGLVRRHRLAFRDRISPMTWLGVAVVLVGSAIIQWS